MVTLIDKKATKHIQSVFLSGDSNNNNNNNINNNNRSNDPPFISSKHLTLSKIYQVPTDIMTQGIFDDVKQLANQHDKWLLVNIQSDSEFQSHLLNRDVFSDDSVKELIKCKLLQ